MISRVAIFVVFNALLACKGPKQPENSNAKAISFGMPSYAPIKQQQTSKPKEPPKAFYLAISQDISLAFRSYVEKRDNQVIPPELLARIAKYKIPKDQDALEQFADYIAKVPPEKLADFLVIETFVTRLKNQEGAVNKGIDSSPGLGLVRTTQQQIQNNAASRRRTLQELLSYYERGGEVIISEPIRGRDGLPVDKIPRNLAAIDPDYRALSEAHVALETLEQRFSKEIFIDRLGIQTPAFKAATLAEKAAVIERQMATTIVRQVPIPNKVFTSASDAVRIVDHDHTYRPNQLTEIFLGKPSEGPLSIKLNRLEDVEYLNKNFDLEYESLTRSYQSHVQALERSRQKVKALLQSAPPRRVVEPPTVEVVEDDPRPGKRQTQRRRPSADLDTSKQKRPEGIGVGAPEHVEATPKIAPGGIGVGAPEHVEAAEASTCTRRNRAGERAGWSWLSFFSCGLLLNDPDSTTSQAPEGNFSTLLKQLDAIEERMLSY